MSKKIKLSGEQQVAEFIATTEHPLKNMMVELRKVILSSGNTLTEHIKWNAPSYCFEGEDRFTFKVNSPKSVDIVFRRGAKVKELPKKNLVEGPQELLKWAATDRGVVAFSGMDDIKAKKAAFIDLINKWVAASV